MRLNKSLVILCEAQFLALALLCVPQSSSFAGPISPVYFHTFQDAVTGTNEFLGTDGKRRWYVDSGADDYQNEFYERPTIDSFDNNNGNDPFSAQEYYSNLDIVEARVGYDAQYLYVAMELYGRGKEDQGGFAEQGLNQEYGFRFSFDPDGRDGYLVRAIQPESEHGTTFGTTKNLAYFDTDSDVGGRGGPIHGNPGPTGLGVTKQDNSLEESGGGSGSMNGYDDQIIADGELAGLDVLFSRIDPTNDHIVEIALDYTALGLTLQQIATTPYLDMQAIKGSPTDPQNYFWNDKWNKLEAGSPYNLVEFGASGGVGGYNAIDELDTVRNGGLPEPSTVTLLAIGAFGVGFYSWRRRRK
jgi:hypothetical protein